VKYLFKPLY